MTTRTHPTNTHATPHPTRTGCPATPQTHGVYLRAQGSQSPGAGYHRLSVLSGALGVP